MLNTDAAYLQSSLEQFAQRPARGPWTMIWNHQAVFLPLANVTSLYGTIRGYQIQLETLASVFENPAQPIIEVAFGGAEFSTPSVGVPSVGILLKPLSRGAVMLNTTDVDAEPTLHYGTLTNPLDIDLLSSFLPFFRRLWDVKTLRNVLGVVEVDPGRGWIRRCRSRRGYGTT
ncbi:GMC oxidoreductase [Apiospora kogelbergensis]|uniref:GMC oxidoreductase n=1 Tax=Apiospora kogelbergensis TaxID=1337665 RepID=A0AAW0QSZ7_9PEZI